MENTSAGNRWPCSLSEPSGRGSLANIFRQIARCESFQWSKTHYPSGCLRRYEWETDLFVETDGSGLVAGDARPEKSESEAPGKRK